MSNLALEVRVAETMEDITLALMIRASVFVGECEVHQIEDERDGNDHSATNLIAYVENVPVGTMRIRYFPKFALFERLAVVKNYRNKKFTMVAEGKTVTHNVVQALQYHALSVIMARGYTEWTGKAFKNVVPLWVRAGRNVGHMLEVEGGEGDYNGTPTQVIHGKITAEKSGYDIDVPSDMLHPSVSKKDNDLIRGIYSQIAG